MHDHGPRTTQRDSELRNLETGSMLGQTKQLHSSHLSHYPFNYPQHYSNQSSQQPILHDYHHHKHQAALYEYMVLQQQQIHHQSNEQQQQQQPHLPHVQKQHNLHNQQLFPQCEDQSESHLQQQQQSQQQQQQQQQTQSQEYGQFKQHLSDSYIHSQQNSFSSAQRSGGVYNGTSNAAHRANRTETEREALTFQDAEEDDEDMLDDEEEKDLLMRYEQCRQNLLRQHPNVASELLQFAQAVSMDIQRFFGRAKGEEDACDVYEDKWAATKSGRELYYADLLRIAQGGDTEPTLSSNSKRASSLASSLTSPATRPTSSASSASSMASLSPQETDTSDTRARFSGKRDISLGMGALSDLFDVGLSGNASREGMILSQRGSNAAVSSAGSHYTAQRTKPTGKASGSHSALKMRERSLPKSFWREPGCSGFGENSEFAVTNNINGSQNSSTMASSKLPDFSDLMESWHGSVEALASPGKTRAPVHHQL